MLMLLGCTLAIAQKTPIESVAPGEAQARVESHQGVVFLNITSTDPNCGYCIRANAKFEALAHAHPEVGAYLQTSWSPWAKFPPEIMDFLKKHGIGGIPARLVYRDGLVIDKLIGEPKDAAPSPTNDKPAAQRVSGRIPIIAASQIGKHIAKTPGTLVVELTSFDTTCTFCMRGNPVFEELADSTPNDESRFVRVVFTPWTSVSENSFAKDLGISGLPVYLTYRDGKLVRRKMGIGSKEEMQKELLNGLQ